MARKYLMVLEPVQIFPPFASFPTQHFCMYICKIIDLCTYIVDYKVVQCCTPWRYHCKVLDFKYRRYLASKSQLVVVFALLARLYRLQKPPVCSWQTSMTSSCAHICGISDKSDLLTAYPFSRTQEEELL